MTAPPRTLRSNFPRGSYLWAVRNAQWQGMGLSEDDCEKPKIAIVNSSSGMAACFAHLDGIVPVLKDADGLNLTGITRGTNDLAARARDLDEVTREAEDRYDNL